MQCCFLSTWFPYHSFRSCQSIFLKCASARVKRETETNVDNCIREGWGFVINKQSKRWIKIIFQLRDEPKLWLPHFSLVYLILWLVTDVEVVEGRGGSYKFVEEDDVLILTRETFHYFILSRQMVLVKFYTPWWFFAFYLCCFGFCIIKKELVIELKLHLRCGHCKELAPEYSRAAKELKKDNITLVKVDADKEVELAKEFMITGYPTIILFRNGEKNDEYHGKRTAYGTIVAQIDGRNFCSRGCSHFGRFGSLIHQGGYAFCINHSTEKIIFTEKIFPVSIFTGIAKIAAKMFDDPF